MSLTLTRPDDWHLHLRDGETLKAVAPFTARQFGRAVIMPNLKPPVRTVADALAYRDRILAALPHGSDFQPLMTLYLTDRTSAADINKAAADPHVFAAKLYPAGATTNSDDGVTDIEALTPVLETMADAGMPLLVHGEVTDPRADVFDREAIFIDLVLEPLIQRVPELKVVLEHVTTTHGTSFVLEGGPNLAGTITVHHLLWNRNAIFQGGLNPHAYCLPVLKREKHRQALVQAAIGDSGKFFLGTDSAPHAASAKESACGCAGIFTAHAALELYATCFEQANALDRLENFASLAGPAFHGLQPNSGQVTLDKCEWMVPESYPLGEDVVVPMAATEKLGWKLQA